MIDIVQKDHKVLRETAKPVSKREFGSKNLEEILENMKKALASQDDGVALAAPQIAVSKRIFIISPKVLEIEKDINHLPLTYINPTIIKKSKDKKKVEEGCLSIRPFYGKVKRASRVTLRAFDQKGEEFEIDGKGLIAQIFQHETEHLDGILFTDKATNLREISLDNSNSLQ
jgi:peptide deformylase